MEQLHSRFKILYKNHKSKKLASANFEPFLEPAANLQKPVVGLRNKVLGRKKLSAELGKQVVASEKGEPVVELQPAEQKPVAEQGNQVVEQQKKVQELQAACRKNKQARYLQAPMDRTRYRCQNMTSYKLILPRVFTGK